MYLQTVVYRYSNIISVSVHYLYSVRVCAYVEPFFIFCLEAFYPVIPDNLFFRSVNYHRSVEHLSNPQLLAIFGYLRLFSGTRRHAISFRFQYLS